MSSGGASASRCTRIMLLPVPSSKEARISSGAAGPYWPKTRSSATPPVIFMPVLMEI